MSHCYSSNLTTTKSISYSYISQSVLHISTAEHSVDTVHSDRLQVRKGCSARDLDSISLCDLFSEGTSAKLMNGKNGKETKSAHAQVGNGQSLLSINYSAKIQVVTLKSTNAGVNHCVPAQTSQNQHLSTLRSQSSHLGTILVKMAECCAWLGFMGCHSGFMGAQPSDMI